jgi:hypothetical protein
VRGKKEKSLREVGIYIRKCNETFNIHSPLKQKVLQ